MANIETLKYWCHKVLPLVYDDSLSYYEVLCKVSEKLNEVIDKTNEFGEHLNQQLLEMRELITTEIARIESELNRKLVEAETAIKEELTKPNSFNGNAIIDGSIADNKLVSKFWHFFNRVPVRQYADLDDILDEDNMKNILRLTVSGLGELSGVIGAGDYTCITNTNNTTMVLLNTETGVSWIYEKGSNNINAVANIPDSSITSEKLANDSVTGEKIANSSVTDEKIALTSIRGGSAGNIKAHTITDFNIATGSLTDRLFADGVLTNKVLFVNVTGGLSTSDIDNALSVGGEKALYYMQTYPTGDLTPNEDAHMWGYARKIGDSYEVVFSDYTGRTWKYVQSTEEFTETTNCISKSIFTETDLRNTVKKFGVLYYLYINVPLSTDVTVGTYIGALDNGKIKLFNFNSGAMVTYDINTHSFTDVRPLKFLSFADINDLIAYPFTLNELYLIQTTAGTRLPTGFYTVKKQTQGTTAFSLTLENISNGYKYRYASEDDEFYDDDGIRWVGTLNSTSEFGNFITPDITYCASAHGSVPSILGANGNVFFEYYNGKTYITNVSGIHKIYDHETRTVTDA